MYFQEFDSELSDSECTVNRAKSAPTFIFVSIAVQRSMLNTSSDVTKWDEQILKQMNRFDKKGERNKEIKRVKNKINAFWLCFRSVLFKRHTHRQLAPKQQ